MARRIKEEAWVHEERIVCAAKTLFETFGIEATTMDMIAKAANYSKATLYVYFKNKEEITQRVQLLAMKRLYERIHNARVQEVSLLQQYDCICEQLVLYYEEDPYYFTTALDTIQIQEDGLHIPLVTSEIYEIGERINHEILAFFEEGSVSGLFENNTHSIATVFVFWASITGIIQMSKKKEAYLKLAMNMERSAFLSFAFSLLLKSVLKKEEMK